MNPPSILDRTKGPLSLAPGRSTSDPRVFLRAFFEWRAVATDKESEQLDAIVGKFAPHVRPLAEVFSDLLRDPDAAKALPPTLLATLVAHGWHPTGVSAPSSAPARSAATPLNPRT